MKPISYGEFLTHCKKATPQSRVYYTYLYHQATYPLSYLLYRLHLTANEISIIGILISIVGGIYIFLGHPIVGTSLFLFSYLLDCCDGNVARIHYGYEKRERGNTLMLGMLLENLYPNISYPLFFISFGMYLFYETSSLFFISLAVFTGFVKLITRYTVLHASHLNKPRVPQEGAPPTNKELYSQGFFNELKYFIVRVLDSARLYYVAFLIALFVIPGIMSQFFVLYMLLILFLNSVKLILTLIYRTP